MKKIVYIDMDGVLVDIIGCIKNTFNKNKIEDLGIGTIIDEYSFIFRNAKPLDGAVKSFNKLANSPKYDVYILSTAPWANEQAWAIKRQWVEKHLGKNAYKRLILSHHKNLLMGDYLIDDRVKNGVDDFKGEHIHFGTGTFTDWDSVLKYLKP